MEICVAWGSNQCASVWRGSKNHLVNQNLIPLSKSQKADTVFSGVFDLNSSGSGAGGKLKVTFKDFSDTVKRPWEQEIIDMGNL